MSHNQGNYDNAANAPYWAVNSSIVKASPAQLHARPTAANVAYLYGNTAPNAYIAGETIGLFMVDSAEEQVKENANGAKPAHSGWVLKTAGSGGRSGRITYETLSVVATVKSDNNADDASFADATITISAQPATVQSVVHNAGGANTLTYTVTASAVPASATLTYQWQVNNNAGGTWVPMSNGGSGQPGGMFNKTGVTTNTLTVAPSATTANNYVFRCVITATNAGITNSSATVNSSNGRILIS
jgi:hypothetical protein